jgi:2-methylcitrate dehydratase PrpD
VAVAEAFVDEEHVVAFLAGAMAPPLEAVERSRLVIEDVVCAAVAGSALAELRGVIEALVLQTGPCTVVGCGCAAPVEQAVTANTVLAIAQEIEEGHPTAGHVGAATVMAALAAAEERDASGAAVIDAVLRAYEVCARVERAVMPMRARVNAATGWVVRNPHSTWTAVGPALAAALVWESDRETLRATWRLAVNLAVLSLWDPYAEGALARNLTAGLSAQAGVTAARWARAGLPGSATAVARICGPLRAAMGAAAFDAWFGSLGATYEITRGYLKPYPSCRYTHPALDALRTALPAAGTVGADAVDRIDVHTFGLATQFAHQHAPTPTSAKFSIPFVLAAFLLDGRIAYDTFTGRLRDPRIDALARRITVYADDGFEAAFPGRWGARVVVFLRDGRVLTGECPDPLGGPAAPLAVDEVRELHLAALRQRVAGPEAAAILEALAHLGTLASVRPLGARLRAVGGP